MHITPKEDAYDAHVAPLMTQIIDLCREHKINMFATFALDRDENDDPLACTTAQPENDPTDDKGADMVEALTRKVRPEFAAVAFTRKVGK